MPLIENYASPTPEDLALLKSSLGLTGTQMAKFAGLAGSNHWRKYTGGELPRVMGMHSFFWAAHLVLNENELNKVTGKMRDIGAKV